MQNLKFMTALGALGIGLAACSGNGGNTPTYNQPPTVGAAKKYVQIERLSRPAIKEVFENFVDHASSNAIEPYQDNLLKTDIKATEDTVRYGNPNGPASGPDYGAAFQGILYPDEYAVDLSQASGGFLTYELAGKFGGRAPDDDVIGAELGVLFGTAVSDGSLGVTLAPADNKQNNCLSTENLASTPASGQAMIASFPYLPTAH